MGSAGVPGRIFSQGLEARLLLLPEQGALTLLTEMGTLQVGPGQVAVIPRGLRFSVLLDEQESLARGYVGEIYAKHFHLPERGLIGSNGLADERHFVAPTPWYEDRIAPGYRLASKLGGKLFEAVDNARREDAEEAAAGDAAGREGSAGQ